jgi:hypothetical protein
MALSRFWTFILIFSIAYALIMLAAGKQHSLGTLVNGNQGDPVLVGEKDSADLHDSALLLELRAAGANGVLRNDTLITMGKGGMVRYTHGTQSADGLFETCKNTVMDLWLPLIGYLTFFCGLMNLLVDSRAMEKLARFLSPHLQPHLPGSAEGPSGLRLHDTEFRRQLPRPGQRCYTLRSEGDGEHAGKQSHAGQGHQQPDHVPLSARGGPHTAAHQHHRLPRGDGRGQPGGHHDPLHRYQLRGDVGCHDLREHPAAH